MGCRRIKKMMSMYIDNELSPVDRESFLLHIKSCPQCSKELAESQAVHQLFTKADKSPAPYGFTARVMENLEHKETPQKKIREFFLFRPFLPRFAGVVLTLAVMVFGIITGNLLVTGMAVPQNTATIEQTFSLDVFQANPPGTLEGAYAVIMEVDNEG
jgi:anti-sigma factor RsiW